MEARNGERFAAAVRSQTAVVRTIADELRRRSALAGPASDLREQVIEEAARLVSVLKDPSRPPNEGLAPDRKAAVRRQEDPTGKPSQPRRRLLLVEDEAATRLALAHWFQRDYQVAVACNGEEGLASAMTCQPDVIITDVWMPKVDGISMVTLMKQVDRLSRIPVVFLTGQTEPESVAAGFFAGAVSYLAKPIDLDLLDCAVLAALAD